MIINLSNIVYYFITIPQNKMRIEHIKSEFKDFNLVEINSVPYTEISGNYPEKIKKLKSGITGFLKIIDKVSKNFDDTSFKPFIILEDDTKKFRNIPEKIELPDDSDICYIGLSLWGMTDSNNAGDYKNSVCYTEVDDNLIKVHNMLSTHGFIVTSFRGLISLQKCLIEDFYRNRGWDMSLTQIQPYINAYALKEPLVYQYKEIGGQEESTKLNYLKLNNKPLPENWKNTTNLSVISIFK